MSVFTTFRDQLYGRTGRSSSEDISSEEDPFLEKQNLRQHAPGRRWPWIATTVSLASALLFMILYHLSYRSSHALSAGTQAHRTDFKDSHAAIELEERVFSGRLWYDKNKEVVYRDIDPSQPQYFGYPSPEIDAAWKDLLHGEFVRMTAEEAAPYTPELVRNPETNYYYFEPDMFHSLHCLNAVRMALDDDYYSKHMSHHAHLEAEVKNSTAFPDDWDRIHIDHCLDQLRQTIQCQGDLSPVPLYHHANMKIGLGVGQTHTCRKWEPMREWMDERKKLHHQDLAW